MAKTLREEVTILCETTTALANTLKKQAAAQAQSNEELRKAIAALKEATAQQRRSLDALLDLENSWPQTKAFLALRGLVDLRQLDADGWSQYKAYLRNPVTLH